MIKKARQADVAAHLDDWTKSPWAPITEEVETPRSQRMSKYNKSTATTISPIMQTAKSMSVPVMRDAPKKAKIPDPLEAEDRGSHYFAHLFTDSSRDGRFNVLFPR
ncbi:hypothetical protein [Bradyrhizobium liaoningense]|uniref:hypothetical protein n=1 Tax=Bradyrhizobium liaoningense TaxID=43992 RepID=UPI002012B031|nr:hypothetical protein [Bradyrhizobium liaoningense]